MWTRTRKPKRNGQLIPQAAFTTGPLWGVSQSCGTAWRITGKSSRGISPKRSWKTRWGGRAVSPARPWWRKFWSKQKPHTGRFLRFWKRWFAAGRLVQSDRNTTTQQAVPGFSIRAFHGVFRAPEMHRVCRRSTEQRILFRRDAFACVTLQPRPRRPAVPCGRSQPPNAVPTNPSHGNNPCSQLLRPVV